jgi:hypothetical protein
LRLPRPLFLRAFAAFQQQTALDGRHGSRTYIAVLFGEKFRIFRHESQQCPEVLQVQQRQALFLGYAKSNVEDSFLRIVQFQQVSQQQWAHFSDRGPDGVPIDSEQVPENNRPASGSEIIDADLTESLIDFGVRGNRLTEAGQIALYVRQENRHTNSRKPFGQHLQAHRLARASRPGNQAMSIAECRQQIMHNLALANQDGINFAHDECFPFLITRA